MTLINNTEEKDSRQWFQVEIWNKMKSGEALSSIRDWLKAAGVSYWKELFELSIRLYNENERSRTYSARRQDVKIGQYFRIGDHKYIAIEEAIRTKELIVIANSVCLNGMLAGTPVNVSGDTLVEVYEGGQHE